MQVLGNRIHSELIQCGLGWRTIEVRNRHVTGIYENLLQVTFEIWGAPLSCMMDALVDTHLLYAFNLPLKRVNWN